MLFKYSIYKAALCVSQDVYSTRNNSITMSSHITLYITNIRTKEGSIRVAIFQDEERFKEERPTEEIRYSKDDLEIQDNSTTVTFSLRPGTYGISLLDDANDNGKMDYNFIGVPREGFGFADYYHGGFSRPKFEDFQFYLNDGENLCTSSTFRYM